MKISEIVQTEGWKKFMQKLYSWGASVVLAGALFKIQHYPGASLMLVIGMSTEVVIFFFSAFEPLPEELDWTLVYPELAGLEEEDEEEEVIEEKTGRGRSKRDGKSLDKLDDVMGALEVNTDVFENIGAGLNKLNETTANLADLTDATVATNEYVSQVQNASSSLNTLSDSFSNSNQQLNESVNELSQSYQNVADMIAKSGNDTAEKFSESGTNLLSTYQQLAESIKGGADAIANESKSYSNKIEEVNKNLGALNSVYELQLQEHDSHLKNTKDIFKGFDKMMEHLKESAEATQNYKNEVDNLSGQVAELNNVYGNMLSSLNVLTK
jgi:gliding motility-associated protein GldL